MGIVLGIDIGSSATKIVAMDESKTILNSLKVSASDPVTAMYGAIGKLLCEERMQIADVEADFQETLKDCREISMEDWKNEKFITKLTGRVLRLIAPLM